MAKFCLRSCWMTPKLFFTKIEFLGFRCTMIYQCFLLRLDCPGPFHKIMTVSNEKFDYILSHWVWQHCKNIAVTSQNNPIERIFVRQSSEIHQTFIRQSPDFCQKFILYQSKINGRKKFLRIIHPNFTVISNPFISYVWFTDTWKTLPTEMTTLL